jgi:hypothetical protein
VAARGVLDLAAEGAQAVGVSSVALRITAVATLAREARPVKAESEGEMETSL